jgi:hypothetical protein
MTNEDWNPKRRARFQADLRPASWFNVRADGLVVLSTK